MKCQISRGLMYQEYILMEFSFLSPKAGDTFCLTNVGNRLKVMGTLLFQKDKKIGLENVCLFKV